MSLDKPLSIVVIGQTITGSRTPQRVAALQRLGHRVRVIPINRDGATYEDRPSLMDRLRYRLRLPADPADCNNAVLTVADQDCDLVWIEAAPMIRAATLHRLRQVAPKALLTWYSEDDMMNSIHRSRWLERAMPAFDWWLTTKSFNLNADEVPSLGVRRMLFVNNSFDPGLHHPTPVSEIERQDLQADMAFVGTFETPRAASLLRLAEAGIAVRVWGNGWAAWTDRHPNLHIENRPVYDHDYAKVVGAAKITLGFLRRGNRDRQTCRTVEIPACGGFMLHEYSDEAAALVHSEAEAGFFRDDDDLVAQAQRWLADDAARIAAAQAAARAMIERGHSHDARLHGILSRLFGESKTP
ncbi:glycosyltransferase [Magnetospirillum sulfuroxidans]|uniref:Glycosyltransferase n=1 Tax=Magnetospirillum sulfuroxidans TaxID=611300 RepID=A0ABS5IH77_9PROT|nr:glycosyltransferase [Magnetospirillum sulfuroxidans]MBR9973699.1 glycosyltransferase [Magnetospirillum sulfuroxidans]